MLTSGTGGTEGGVYEPQLSYVLHTRGLRGGDFLSESLNGVVVGEWFLPPALITKRTGIFSLQSMLGGLLFTKRPLGEEWIRGLFWI